MMKKYSGIIYTDQGTFRRGTVGVQDEIITSVELEDREISSVEFPESDRYEGEVLILPGLVDIHSHGAIGYDVCTADDNGLKRILDYERRNGITSYLAATMTLPEEELIEACIRMRHVADENKVIKGIYLEGPFISREKCGAQNPNEVRLPDLNMLNRLQVASGNLICFVALAPELQGAITFIEACTREMGITCSIAHTNADYNQAINAMNAGCSQVTHLYNAMPPMLHRQPGVVGAVYDRDDVAAELICDGIHVHPAMVRNTYKQLGEGRVILISDSMEAAGMPDGRYMLGGQPVQVQNKKAVLDGDAEVIAGSAVNLMDCVRNAVAMGIPFESVLQSATITPARQAGIDDHVGSVTVGKSADLIIMNHKLEIEDVIS